MAEKTKKAHEGDTGQPILITLQQAEKLSGVPYTSLRALIFSGHLKRVKLGESSRWWVRRADVERLIDQSTETVS